MDLKTSEKFILLAIHPTKGNIRTNHLSFRYGMIGAILIDLVESGKVEIINKRLRILDFKYGSDKIVSTALSRLRKPKKEKKIDSWLIKLCHRYRYYKRESLRNMEREGLIRIEQKIFLNIIPYKRYIIRDIKVQKDLISDIREGLFTGRTKLTEDNTQFIALLKVCRLSKVFSSIKERKTIRKELRGMIKQYPIVKAVDHVITQMHIAISVPGVLGPIIAMG